MYLNLISFGSSQKPDSPPVNIIWCLF